MKQQLSSGSGGRGLVIQDVHAPPEVVWGRIMDFPAYTRMVPRVSLCENYKVQENYMQGLKVGGWVGGWVGELGDRKIEENEAV